MKKAYHVSHGVLASARPGESFTLIELLIVTAILGVLAAAIGACLAGGVRAWDTARKVNAADAEAVFGMDILQRDLMNAFLFEGVQFRGTPGDLSFPGLIGGSQPGAAGETDGRIGAVSYGFDWRNKALLRQESSYPDGLAGAQESVVSGLDRVSFSYAKGGVWMPEWDSATGFPDRVRVQLVFGLTLGGDNIVRDLEVSPAGAN